MTTWILLRGLTREAAHWGGFVDQLAAAVPGAEPVTIDMPGTGSRRGVASPWRLGAVTDACREHWRSRGRKGRMALVGLSPGGDGGGRLGTAVPGRSRSRRPHQRQHERVRRALAAPPAWQLVAVAARADGRRRAVPNVSFCNGPVPIRRATEACSRLGRRSGGLDRCGASMPVGNWWPRRGTKRQRHHRTSRRWSPSARGTGW